MYSIYFLRSLRNSRIYVGYTEKDPQDRFREHLSGTNKWTRENGPFELLYYEKYHCQQDAMMRERFYKTGYGRQIRDAILSAVSAKGGSVSGGGSAPRSGRGGRGFQPEAD